MSLTSMLVDLGLGIVRVGVNACSLWSAVHKINRIGAGLLNTKANDGFCRAIETSEHTE
jgi:hypothetical protein